MSEPTPEPVSALPNEDFAAGDAGGGGVLLAVEEAPALEFDDSEIPSIDSPVSELSVEEFVRSVPAEAVSPDAEVPPSDAGQEEGGPEETLVLPEAGAGPSGFDIDESVLTLEGAEDGEPPFAEEPPSGTLSGQRTLDLEEIDLSDLTDSPGGLDAAQAGSSGEVLAGAGFDDTMDLSLLVEDDGQAGGRDDISSVETGSYSELAPIDLTLVDDALIELTVEGGREDRVGGGEELGAGLELSMEVAEK